MFSAKTVMQYVLQKKPLFDERNRHASRRCHSDEELAGNLDLKERDLNYLTTMRVEKKEDFTDIEPDESLMEYLDSQTGRMKTHLIETNQFWDYMAWQDKKKRRELKAQYEKLHDPDLYHAVGPVKYKETPFATFVKYYLEDECNKMVALGIRNQIHFEVNAEKFRIRKKREEEHAEEVAAEREEHYRRSRKRRRTKNQEAAITDDKDERAQ